MNTTIMQAWANQNRTQQREMILEPNRGSAVDIQKFTFGLTTQDPISLGAGATSFSMEGRPETNIRPKRVTTNAFLPGAFFLESIRVANVGAIVGGEIDAFALSAGAVESLLDVPTITPANSIKVTGSYTNLVGLAPFDDGNFFFRVSFKGRASMTP